LAASAWQQAASAESGIENIGVLVGETGFEVSSQFIDINVNVGSLKSPVTCTVTNTKTRCKMVAVQLELSPTVTTQCCHQ
jgi:hypothetical protein